MAKRRRITDEEAKNISTIDSDDKEKKAKDEAIKKLTDPVEIMNVCRRSAKDARSLHKNNWDKNWDLYNNSYDWSLKADWQAKNFVPIVPILVRGIKYLIKKSVVTAGDFFTVNFPAIPKDSEFKDDVNGWGREIIRKVLDDNKFSTLISEATAISLLESLLILKVLPRGNSGVTITTESAYNILIDPTGRNRWLIQSIETDLDIVQQRGLDGTYIQAEIDKAVEDFSRQPEATDDAQRKQQQTSPTVNPPYRKTCVIDEWYGDLIDGEGKAIMKDCSFSVLNEKYLIRKPFKLKSVLDHGKRPIVIAAVNPKPKSIYHQALISDVSGLCHMATELLNLTSDTNLMSMAKAFELDIGQIADPADVAGGVVPGKTYKKKGSSANSVDKPMIRAIDVAGPTQQDMMMVESVKNEIQRSVGFYNEFGMAELAKKPGGRATAREVTARESSTSGAMRSLAEEIEEQVMIPMLEMVWSNMVQFFRDFDQLEGILPPELIQFLHLQKDGLKVIFGDAAHFKAKGMSGVLARYEELEKIQAFVSQLKMFPQVYPMLEPQNILEAFITNYGWDKKKFMKSDEEITAMMNQPPMPPQGAMPPQGGGM